MDCVSGQGIEYEGLKNMAKGKPELYGFSREEKEEMEQIQKAGFFIYLELERETSNSYDPKSVLGSMSRRAWLDFEVSTMYKNPFFVGKDGDRKLIQVKKILPCNRYFSLTRNKVDKVRLEKDKARVGVFDHLLQLNQTGFDWRLFRDDMVARYSPEERYWYSHRSRPETPDFSWFEYGGSGYGANRQPFSFRCGFIGRASAWAFYRIREPISKRIIWFRLNTYTRGVLYWEQGDLPDFFVGKSELEIEEYNGGQPVPKAMNFQTLGLALQRLLDETDQGFMVSFMQEAFCKTESRFPSFGFTTKDGHLLLDPQNKDTFKLLYAR